jgi:hypothetical protein
LDLGLWPNRNGRRSLGLRTTGQHIRNTGHRTTDDGSPDGAVEDLLPVIRREELFVLIDERNSRLVNSFLRTLGQAFHDRAFDEAHAKASLDGVDQSALCRGRHLADNGCGEDRLQRGVDATGNKGRADLLFPRLAEQRGVGLGNGLSS